MPKVKRLKRTVSKKDKAELLRLKKLFQPFGRFPISVSFRTSDELFNIPLPIVRRNLRDQMNKMRIDFDSLWQKSWDDMKLAYYFERQPKHKRTRSDR